MRRIRLGQSIVEVVIATSLIAIGVVAALSLTNQSQKSSNYSKLLDIANSYNNQLADYFRQQKRSLGWKEFTDKISRDSIDNYALYCYSTLIESENFFSKSSGLCSSSDKIINTPFSRHIEFNLTQIDSGILTATIITSWEEKRTRQSTLNLELTSWK